ncbi:MAG: ABC transporter permease [Acidimicrobiia bacterium]
MIEFLGEVMTWFGDNWWGPKGIISRSRSHFELSGAALITAAVLAMPPAFWLGHRRRGTGLVTALVNSGRAIPTFGIVVLALPIMIWIAGIVPWMSTGIGFPSIYVALVALAIPPIFIHTHTAILAVSPDVVEAATGMGMTGRQILRRIELPLAVPVIMTGIRVTAVQVVATAPLGALVAHDALGRFIIDGFAVRDSVRIFAGALLVAAAALLTDAVFGAVERRLTPSTRSDSATPQSGSRNTSRVN